MFVVAVSRHRKQRAKSSHECLLPHVLSLFCLSTLFGVVHYVSACAFTLSSRSCCHSFLSFLASSLHSRDTAQEINAQDPRAEPRQSAVCLRDSQHNGGRGDT